MICFSESEVVELICFSESEVVELMPVASRFDLRVIATPAVVVQPPVVRQPTLVCGYSLEVNATSDLDFFVSVDQVSLLERVLSSNIQALVSLCHELTPIDAAPRSKQHATKHSVSSFAVPHAADAFTIASSLASNSHQGRPQNVFQGRSKVMSAVQGGSKSKSFAL